MRKQRRTSSTLHGAASRRRLVIVLTLLAIAITALATTAAASSSRGLNTERPRASQPRLRQPPLAWLQGTLQQHRTGGWMLADGTPLSMAKKVRWREEEGGHETVPVSGREVRLMGQWYGNTFHVRQATLLSAQWAIDRSTTLPEVPADQPIREQPQ